MRDKPDSSQLIVDILKKHPRGLNIREIAEKSRINRMSVARYLEVLTASGTAEVRSLGNAKIYYLSRQVPVTTFMEYTSKSYCITDRDLTIVQINEWLPGTSGQSCKEILGATLPDVIRQRIVNFEECRAAMDKALAGETTTVVAEERTNGRHMFFEICHMPIPFPDGSSGMMAISENITTRKLVEIALREQRERYRDLVENIPHIVFSTDADGAITYISPRVAEYGIVPDNLVGLHPDRLILPEDLEMVRTEFHAICRSAGPVRGIRFRATAADGRVVFLEGDCMVRKNTSGACIGINGILRDVTDGAEEGRSRTGSYGGVEGVKYFMNPPVSIDYH